MTASLKMDKTNNEYEIQPLGYKMVLAACDGRVPVFCLMV